MHSAIRASRMDDAEAIARVQVESWRSTYRGIVPDAVIDGLSVETQTAMWQTRFGEDGPLIFVAEDGDRVFGFVSGGVLREPVKNYDAELYAIYLLQSRQRQGIGLALVQALAEALRNREFKSMLVWVLAANPAVSFYRRLGAVEESRKLIVIGDMELPEQAFGWVSLSNLIAFRLPRLSR